MKGRKEKWYIYVHEMNTLQKNTTNKNYFKMQFYIQENVSGNSNHSIYGCV